MLNKYLFHFFLFFQLFILNVSAQKTIICENFGEVIPTMRACPQILVDGYIQGQRFYT